MGILGEGEGGRRPANWGFGWIKKKRKKPINIPSRTTHILGPGRAMKSRVEFKEKKCMVIYNL